MFSMILLFPQKIGELFIAMNNPLIVCLFVFLILKTEFILWNIYKTCLSMSFVCMSTCFLRWSADSQALMCYPPWSHLLWEKSDLLTCWCSASCASLLTRWRMKDCSENEITLELSSSEFESKEPGGRGGILPS